MATTYNVTLKIKQIFKSLYLALKTKYITMKKAKHYLTALECQESIFTLMQDYISFFNSDPEVIGYVSIEKRDENSVNISMGSERFTIVSNIQDYGIMVFNVYIWKFSLSSLTGYSDSLVEDLIMIKNGNSLCFKHTQYDYDNRDYIHITNMSPNPSYTVMERVFDQFEIYVSNRNNDTQLKVH